MKSSKICILIGFQYSNSKSELLPGTIVDLYKMYKLAKRANFDKYMIITDIKQKESYKYHSLIMDNIVDNQMFEFLSNLVEKDQYFHCQCRDDFFNILDKNLYPYDKLLLYYTGHAKTNYILFPNDTQMAFAHFRDLLLSQITFSAELFIVLDCCQSSSFNLAFRYKNNNQTLRYTINHENSLFFCPQKIIIIASTLKEEDSFTSHIGSYFTSAFVDILSTNEQSLYNICKHLDSTKYNQMITIYASFPNLYHLWSWTITPSKSCILLYPYAILVKKPITFCNSL